MVTPTIIPKNGGIVTVTKVAEDHTYGDYAVYEINAIPNPGFVFKTLRGEYYSENQLSPGKIYSWSTNRSQREIVEENIRSGSAYSIQYYTLIEATFEALSPPPATKFTVTTGMTPNAARGSTSGDGEYEEGTECTISCAAKCSLWIFDHWEFSTGETYNTQSVTFTVTADVTCTAVFRHENTGQLIYDADGSGSLICAADGSILYDGDSVDQ